MCLIKLRITQCFWDSWTSTWTTSPTILDYLAVDFGLDQVLVKMESYIQVRSSKVHNDDPINAVCQGTKEENETLARF